MKKLFILISLSTVLSFNEADSLQVSSQKIRLLYNSLRAQSISEHLAFYHLYPQSPEGQKALKHAWNLLAGTTTDFAFDQEIRKLPQLHSAIEGIVNLVNKSPEEITQELTEEELAIIERVAQRLPNRKLKGYFAKNEKEVLALPPDQIDLAHGLLLSQYESNQEFNRKIRSYEAMIDLMALQILAQLSSHSTAEQKIRAINRFVFEELGFRFPPHSLYAKDIDLYTFLPSVLDSRRGVCLGVSILYICLAQRLNLPLEMITPPGHIFVRYRQGKQIINIETTARGINLDSEEYLSVDTCALQQRNIKEVIGLAHFNQAAVFWKTEKHDKALQCYEKAKLYLPDDLHLTEVMAYNYLFVGDQEKGLSFLSEVKDYLPNDSVFKETIAEDYINGNCDIEGLKAVFMFVDESRESILSKQQALENVIAQFPRFRAGLLQLATSWLQLNREGEALKILEEYHQIEQNDPTVEYYLAVLYGERHDYLKAWEHLKNAEKLTQHKQHFPKALKDLRKELRGLCPE